MSLKTEVVHPGKLFQILLSAWPYFVFDQVSAVARILFPMATLGPARWAALKGSTLLAALYPVDQKSIHDHRKTCTTAHSHTQKKTQSLVCLSVWDNVYLPSKTKWLWVIPLEDIFNWIICSICHLGNKDAFEIINISNSQVISYFVLLQLSYLTNAAK